MPDIDKLLINLCKSNLDNLDSSRIIVLKNKFAEFPIIEVFYVIFKSKYNSIEKIAIKYFPLIYFESDKTYKILQPNSEDKDTHNYFQIIMNHKFKNVVLSSGGDGFLIFPQFIRNYGLGSFAFYKLINEVKSLGYGHYSLSKQPIGGKEKDAYARFMFYLKHGLSLSPEAVSTQGKSGEYFASSIDNLTSQEPTNILMEMTMKEYSKYLEFKNKEIRDALINRISNKERKKSFISKVFLKS